jgi:hypothetical protein
MEVRSNRLCLVDPYTVLRFSERVKGRLRATDNGRERGVFVWAPHVTHANFSGWPGLGQPCAL